MCSYIYIHTLIIHGHGTHIHDTHVEIQALGGFQILAPL